jgi:acetyltransferase-like isoleucine patch superfamily enzyme
MPETFSAKIFPPDTRFVSERTIKLGDNVSIGTQSCIEHHVDIAKGVRIHSQVFVPEYTKLEEGAWLGPNTVLTNAKYPRSANVKDKLAGPIVQQNAIIGANSTLLPGVVVGKDALVGSASLVSKDIPAGEVHYGNPAKGAKNKNEIEDYQ